MQTEQLINQIFQENFSRAGGSPLQAEIMQAIATDYEKNHQALENLEKN